MLTIERISDISVEDFYSIYLDKNKPCIFEKTFTDDWKCIQYWLENSKINFNNIFKFNNLSDIMYVADCNAYYFDSHKKSDMSIEDFLTYWNQFHDLEDDRLLYLKDWHYFLNKPRTMSSFNLLPYFSSDWLNEFYDVRTDVNDDYRFVYIGVKGTWTGLHVDVFQSYSWSANIIGEKRWILFPPGLEPSLPSGVNNVRNLPNWQDIPHIELIQHRGEVVFVPSGWYHQVENITDCVSINHNWINGFNIDRSLGHLRSQLNEVEHETEGVRDTPGYIEQCQVCLKAYSGMNFEEFIVMVQFIMYKRFSSIITSMGISLEGWSELHGKDIPSMRLFFERVFCENIRSLLAIFDRDRVSTELGLVDIVAGLRVLLKISADDRCQDLQLISCSMIAFIQSCLGLIGS